MLILSFPLPQHPIYSDPTTLPQPIYQIRHQLFGYHSVEVYQVSAVVPILAVKNCLFPVEEACRRFQLYNMNWQFISVRKLTNQACVNLHRHNDQFMLKKRVSWKRAGRICVTFLHTRAAGITNQKPWIGTSNRCENSNNPQLLVMRIRKICDSFTIKKASSQSTFLYWPNTPGF